MKKAKKEGGKKIKLWGRWEVSVNAAKRKSSPRPIEISFYGWIIWESFAWEERDIWVDKKALLCLCICVHEYRIIISVIMMIKN